MQLLDGEHAEVLNSASVVAGSVMEREFYRGLAQRVRGIAERADPFTRRRLLVLAERYDAKGRPQGTVPRAEKPLPLPRVSLHIVKGPGEA